MLQLASDDIAFHLKRPCQIPARLYLKSTIDITAVLNPTRQMEASSADIAHVYPLASAEVLHRNCNARHNKVGSTQRLAVPVKNALSKLTFLVLLSVR